MNRTKGALFSGVLFLVAFALLLSGMTGGAKAASSRAANAAPVTCGKWTIVPAGSSNVKLELQAVSARSSNDVWAVGWISSLTSYVPTYTEHWDGTQWTTVPSPSVKKQTNVLNAVSADASNDVWAVGYYGPPSGSPTQSLIEHWNGTQWSIVSHPHVGGGDGLFGVAAIAPNNVWVVGNSGVNGNISTLIEHWDGTQWSVVNSPVPPGADRYGLSSITAISASNIWASGPYQAGPRYKSHALIEHWNGTQWSIVKTPAYNNDVTLAAITAVSASDIWAVGDTHGKSLTVYAFAEHWNGTQWSIVSIPSVTHENYLYSVTAVSSNDVWSVGFAYNKNVEKPLVEHWDGTQWSIATAPHVLNSSGGTLSGASALSDGTVWAVGAYTGTGSSGGLNAYTC